MNLKNYLGLFVIITVILGMGGYALYSSFSGTDTGTVFRGEPEAVKGYLGWEKRGFFEDEEVQRIFRDNHGLEVEINKKGSIEMVSEPADGMNYLFPSNKIALELYKNNNPDAKSETIFFSPIVVYSWQSLIPDLKQAGLVTESDGVHTLDIDKLLGLIQENQTWQDIGAKELQGKITISSTDPSKSSSGNLFSALVLNSFTQKSSAVTMDDLTPEVRQEMSSFFAKMGLLDSSSGDIFEKFLTLGRSTYPFVVGYESQYIELINQNRPNAEQIVPLYPKATVWAEHEFISLDEKGDKLLTALQNQEQFGEISWQEYGLRKTGVSIDNQRYKDYGIAGEVNNFLPLPRVEVMEEVITLI
jgi:hypothetical protein